MPRTANHVFSSKQDRQNLGDKLALSRLKKGYTQAHVLREAGILTPSTRGLLTYAEAGLRGMTKEQLTSLAEYLEVSPRWLSNGEALTDEERSLLKTLRAGVKGHGKVGRPRKIKDIAPKRQRKLIAQAMGPVEPRQSAQPAQVVSTVSDASQRGFITQGDISMLDVIRDCSEPEKAWLVSGVALLKEKMRPKPTVTFEEFKTHQAQFAHA